MVLLTVYTSFIFPTSLHNMKSMGTKHNILLVDDNFKMNKYHQIMKNLQVLLLEF